MKSRPLLLPSILAIGIIIIMDKRSPKIITLSLSRASLWKVCWKRVNSIRTRIRNSFHETLRKETFPRPFPSICNDLEREESIERED